MGILELLPLVLKLANYMLGMAEKRQLMSAGAAKASAKSLRICLGNIKRAQAARTRAKHDPEYRKRLRARYARGK